MIANIFLFLNFTLFTLLHPLHLSVLDIVHDQESHSLEITQRIFADDLEDALRSRVKEKVDVLNPADPDALSELIGSYVKQNLEITLNSRPVSVNYLGYELEEDAAWVYLEVPEVRNFKNISVKNTLFFELFDDQLNLINVKKNGAIRSMKLVPEEEKGSLSYK